MAIGGLSVIHILDSRRNLPSEEVVKSAKVSSMSRSSSSSDAAHFERQKNNEPPDEIVDSIRVKKFLHFRIQQQQQMKENVRTSSSGDRDSSGHGKERAEVVAG